MLHLKEKISYGLGDFGCNVVFATVSTWFVPYSISLGLSAAQAGLVLFLSKFIDAICDVILGIVIDNNQNKIKKLMKISVIPTIVFLLALFSVQYFPQTSRFFFLFLFFNLTNSIFYNFFNIPYSSLNLAITDNESDRFALNCFRMAGSISCMIIINIIYPIVVNKFALYLVCSIVMALCFLATIYGTKMRVPIKKNPINLKYFKDILLEPLFWASIVVFFAINFKLNVTMCQIGMDAKNVNPGLATIFLMVPSIALLFVLPHLFKTDNSKYLALTISLVIDLAIVSFIPQVLVRYLIDGIVFSMLASMIYNLFAGVNEKIYSKTQKQMSGLIFAIAGIISNLCAGFLGFCLMKQIDLNLALQTALALGFVSALLMWILHYRLRS